MQLELADCNRNHHQAGTIGFSTASVLGHCGTRWFKWSISCSYLIVDILFRTISVYIYIYMQYRSMVYKLYWFKFIYAWLYIYIYIMVVRFHRTCPLYGWMNFAHSMNQWEACISFSSRCSSRSRSISLTPSRKVPQLQPTMVDDDIAPLEAMGRPSVWQLNPKSLREFAMCTCKKNNFSQLTHAHVLATHVPSRIDHLCASHSTMQ